MVHALKQAHALLQPGGLLLDIHDLPVPHAIEVRSAGIAHKAGWLLDRVDFVNERSAWNALAQVVSEGLFTLEDEREFTFSVYIDDPPEFQKWLADRWDTAYLPEKTIQRLADLFQQAGQNARVVLQVPARMSRLKVA